MRYVYLLLALFVAQNVWAGASGNFDGDSSDGNSIDFANPSDLVIGTDSFTAIVLQNWDGTVDPGGGVAWLAQEDGTGTGRSWLYYNNSGTDCAGNQPCPASFLGGSATGCQDGTKLEGSDPWEAYAVISDEGAGTVSVYYENHICRTLSKTVEAATGNIRLGRHKSNTTSDFKGDMAVFVLCEQVLTDSEIDEIEAFPLTEPWRICGDNLYILAHITGDSAVNLVDTANNGTLNDITESTDAPEGIFYPGGPQ